MQQNSVRWQKQRATRKHMWDHHISTQALGQDMAIDSMDAHITRRQLRYLGHVSRMDFEHRLPRRMLTAWVPNKRPNGAPCMTYGRTIGKALDKFHIDRETWPLLAADRSAWRETLRLGRRQRSANPSGSHSAPARNSHRRSGGASGQHPRRLQLSCNPLYALRFLRHSICHPPGVMYVAV